MTHRPTSRLTTREKAARRQKRLGFEPLETRVVLSSSPIVAVGSQPSGALDDKIVYVHGGHGYTADNLGSGAWSTQRPLLLNMVEDMGNQDQLTFFAEYLFNAGATVAPLRPIGHQPNEVVMDNDDPGVTFTGAWSDSSASVYFGDPGDVPYRFASTSATETATAEYRPNIPESGYYPVYAWTRSGSDRAADQLYRVNHSGGATEVTVNHRRVGNGVIYLGTYYFEAGTEGSVEISNRSSESGRVVIADMIRFGNGVGDIDRGGGVSGFDREDEAGLYWVQWHVDHSQGIPTSEYRTSSTDSTATVSLSPRYAEYMNREADGSLSDRLFVSFHSNAGGGRGVVGLHNTANGGATPNQLFLAATLGQEVNDDLVAQNGQFEHNWSNRGSNVTFQASFNYGEINNSSIQNEFDATIVETAFHDNQFDAELMRDPTVRDAIARATYQGVVNYFNSVDGGATPDIDLPGKVTDVRVETTEEGSVTVHWQAPVANSYNGGAATGYVIYASTNGYGFDGGTVVAGGGATSTTLTELDPTKTYYFKVAATNAGGQSPGSEVVAAAATGAAERVLIVNGFDRLDRTQNPTQTHVSGGALQRVRPLQSNSFDYAVQMASAIHAVDENLAIETTANELVASGAVNLADYDAVFWILGEESTADDTFDPAEQAAVAAYLSGGGSLFVSGAEIGWDLDNLGGGQAFYHDSLKASYVADDANTYQAQGVAGSIFEGISLSFDNGSQFYDVGTADVITTFGGSQAALNYSNGAGAAAVQYNDGAHKLVMLAFPFETITSEQVRTQVMQSVLDYFEVEGDSVPTINVTQILDNDDGPTVYTETGGWITSSDPGFEGGTFRFNLIGSSGTAQWVADLPQAGMAQVYVQYAAGSNRATGAAFSVESGGQTISKSVNQTTSNFQWVLLGSLQADAGPLTVTLDTAASTGAAFSLVVADAVRVVLAVPAAPSGDFNDDGFVDAADYTVWRNQLGQSVPQGTGGDANFDGLVDAADYAVWREQYGTAVAQPAAYNAAPAFASQLSTVEPVVVVDSHDTPNDSALEALAASVVLSEEHRVRGPHRPATRAERSEPQLDSSSRDLLLLARSERQAAVANFWRQAGDTARVTEVAVDACFEDLEGAELNDSPTGRFHFARRV